MPTPNEIVEGVRRTIQSRYDLIPKYSMIDSATLDPRAYPAQVVKCSQSLEAVRELLSDMSLLQYQLKEARDLSTSASLELAVEDCLRFYAAVKESLETKEGTLRSHLQVLRGLLSASSKAPRTYGDTLLDGEVDP